MEETRNELPPLGTAEEAMGPDLLRSRKWFGTDTTGLLLDFAEPYNPPKWTLSYGGVPFAKLGDLHVVTGKSGHGKTAFMSQIIAAIITGECCGMKYELDMEKPPVVLYIDTEQSKDDSIAIKNRICTLAGMNISERSEQFLFARLRETETPELRYNQILQLLYEIKPNITFIDGAIDLISDYNNQETCSQLIRDIMITSTYYNMSIWVVLHENPTSPKMVGSLGSIAERKVTEVFKIHKHKNENNTEKYRGFPKVFFRVEQLKARGQDHDDWYFIVSNKEHTWGMPKEYNHQDPTEATSHTADEVKQWITNRQHDVEWPATYTEVYQRIFAPEGITDTDEQKALMTMAMNRRFILKQPKADMMPNQRTPRLILNEQEILPL